MGYRESRAAITRRLDLKTDTTPDPMALGLIQSAGVALEQFRAEDTTNSQSRAVERFHGTRNAEIDRMIDSGEIPQAIVEENTKQVDIQGRALRPVYRHDYHALAAWANENAETQFDADDEEMIQTMRAEREHRQRLLANGNALGEFAGNMGGAMTDPLLLGITLATLPLGPAAIPARAGLQSVVLRTALMEGLIGIATEIPIQAEVSDFKHRIDSPFTLSDAVTNILFAGGGGFVLGGAIQLGAQQAVKYVSSKRLAELREQYDLPDDLDFESEIADQAGAAVSAAGRPLEAERRQVSELSMLAEELESLPADTTVGEHLESLVNTEREINEPRNPEVETATEEDIEPEFTPEDLDMPVTDEDGVTMSLGERKAAYEKELAAEEAELDSILEQASVCSLLPRGAE
jgi:hypothetical protein